MSNNKLNCTDTQDLTDDTIDIENNSNVTYMEFDEMNLDENVLRGVYAYGFEHPSIIQQRAIVPIIQGKDIIAQAQSGTGKTGTFTIGISQRIYNGDSQKTPQALILAPTRELAYQINQVVINLNIYTGLKSIVCVGGTPIRDNIRILRKDKRHIVIGTPGRVIDLINRGALNTSFLKIICFDEADEMLSRGFQDNVRNIFQRIPSTTQVLLVSATLPSECLEISNKFMNKPIEILVKKENLTLEGIRQFFVDCQEEKYIKIVE